MLMQRGRKKKPVEELKFEGTYREDRHGDRKEASKDIIKATEIEAPSDLCESAKDVFNKQMEPLLLRGLIAEQDKPFIQLTIAPLIQNIIYLREQIKSSTDDKQIMNYISLLNKTIQSYSQIMFRFYVSPVERANLVCELKRSTSRESLADKIINERK
jgi:hypothetical protein